MFKLVAVACLALAFATHSAAQSVIQKAQQAEQKKAQEQKAQQQKAQEQKAQGQQASKSQESPHMKKARANCNAKADGQKLKGDARKRYMDDCVKT